MGAFPSATCLISWLFGKFSTISRVSMRSVRKEVSLASRAASSIFSGWSCDSIHLSTPICATRSTSPGRGPNVRRLSAWTARRCSSMALVGFSFLPNANWVVASPATSKAATTSSRRLRNGDAIRVCLMENEPRAVEKVARQKWAGRRGALSLQFCDVDVCALRLAGRALDKLEELAEVFLLRKFRLREFHAGSVRRSNAGEI